AFRRVILPLAAPGVLAASLYAFTQAWNEFLYALVFITDVKLRTLPVGLSTFITGDVYGWGYLMAGAVLTTIPVIAAYIYLQKYMVGALPAGSVKGSRAGLRRQVESFHDARIRDLGRFVQLLDELGAGGLEQTHASSLVRHERAANVAHRLAGCRHLLARLDRALLRRSQLVHRDALQAALDHIHGHGKPSLVMGERVIGRFLRQL